MNWQIIVGVFFLICGISGITENFSTFLGGLVIGGLFLFWGLKTRKGKNGIAKSISEHDDIQRQLEAKDAEHKAAQSLPDLTPEALDGHPRNYHYKDVNVWVVWQFGGQYGKTCESIGIRRGDLLELGAPPKPDDDPDGVALFWKGTHIGYMKRNRMQDMVHEWKNAGLPIQAVVSYLGGESKLLVEFAFYGTPAKK